VSGFKKEKKNSAGSDPSSFGNRVFVWLHTYMRYRNCRHFYIYGPSCQNISIFICCCNENVCCHILIKKKKEECMLSYVKNHGKVMFHSMLGKRVLSDAWALDTAQKPYVWQRLNPEGDRPSARM
jgi:hypothetical protein